jgi:hypothetical protein
MAGLKVPQLAGVVSRLLAVALMLALSVRGVGADPAAPVPFATDVVIHYSPGHALNRFRAEHALGAGIDGSEKGDTERQLTPANIAAMESVGLKSLTLRLRTELAIDAWHWNPSGSWSDPARVEGYWTSDSTADAPIAASYGYALPRRGNTIDQANNVGYSRLDDADESSFWKSNPFLDAHFTHDSNARHEQWVVVDFGETELVNAARLLWGVPFARRYEIQYATITDISAISLNPPGMWKTFPHGKVRRGVGGDDFRILAPTPIATRYLRILLRRSSLTNASGSSDIRDAVGYAMRELYLGSIDKTGEFRDVVRHASVGPAQTTIFVSSTDPWHSTADLDERVEEPGFDRVMETGLAHGLPVLVATGLLYDTPDNAAAEIRYLKSRHFPLHRIELGEEPDGQYATPEDYGALYVQFADAIHAVDPTLQLGGPSFQEILPDGGSPRKRLGNSAWFRRFKAYLHSRGRDGDYNFFSFEWYPIEDVCAAPPPKLVAAHRLLGSALREMQRRGLTHRLPWIISEFGYSAYAARAELGIEGALLDADVVGQFLSLGGDQAFIYGYTPGYPDMDQPCSVGNNLMFAADDSGGIAYKFATYFAAQMVSQIWTQPSDGEVELFRAAVNSRLASNRDLLSAYPIKRHDGLWSVLFINRDPNRSSQMRIHFRSSRQTAASPFAGEVDVFQFSPQQYALSPEDSVPYPTKSEAPSHSVVQITGGEPFNLPAYSITVVRGRTRADRLGR